MNVLTNPGMGDWAIGAGSSIFGLLLCCFYIVFALFSVFVFIFWIYCLIDAILRQEKDFGSQTRDDNKKVLWILILILGNWIGALIYYFLVIRKYPRKQKV